jgi:glycine oxidase
MRMENSSSDVVIVGGGIIGLSLAYQLALQKASVTVLERGQIGQEASTAGAGILAPQAEMEEMSPLTDLCLASKSLYSSFVQELVSRTGVDIEFSQTGLLYVGFSGEDQQELARRYRWQKERGLPVQQLSPGEALEVEKNLNPNIVRALFFPQEAYVDNIKLVEALRIACGQMHVQLVTGCQGISVKADGHCVMGVESNSGFWKTGKTVIAAGSWSGMVTTPLTYRIPISPVRGQVIAVKSSLPFLGRTVYSHKGYLVPRRDGRIFLGTTVEWAGYDKSVTVDGVHQILSATLEILPGIKPFPIQNFWAGFRPHCEDGNPVLGPSEIEGLIFATGHFRNGLLLAPITAKLLADLILNGTTSKLLEGFSPSRFRKTPLEGGSADS